MRCGLVSPNITPIILLEFTFNFVLWNQSSARWIYLWSLSRALSTFLSFDKKNCIIRKDRNVGFFVDWDIVGINEEQCGEKAWLLRNASLDCQRSREFVFNLNRKCPKYKKESMILTIQMGISIDSILWSKQLYQMEFNAFSTLIDTGAVCSFWDTYIMK